MSSLSANSRACGVCVNDQPGTGPRLVADGRLSARAGGEAVRQSDRLALTRRQFLSACGVGALALATPSFGAVNAPKSVAVAEAFDREVEEFMGQRNIPGGALAVVKGRRLVHARGYGWADREKKVAAQADTLFRLASLSKPITAVAVLKLAEEKKLELDTPAFDIVRLQAVLKPVTLPDPRLKKVTVRHLLQHTGGWDKELSYDPMFRAREIAGVVGVACPPGPRDIIHYMLGEPLDFAPGTRYAYSNFGYCTLGRVIEEVSGQPYEQFVQEKVLAPIGIKRMRLGASLLEKRAEGEARYYMTTKGTTRSVFRGAERVPWPYGGFYLEAMDAHGGWIASVLDLARFAAALDDPRRSPLLRLETIRTMHAPPAAPVSRKPDGSLKEAYYGCGWMVRTVAHAGLANYWHSGSMPGSFTLLVRRFDGLSWAVLFNQRSEDIKLPDAAIDGALHRAAEAVTKWPEEDLFEQQ